MVRKNRNTFIKIFPIFLLNFLLIFFTQRSEAVVRFGLQTNLSTVNNKDVSTAPSATETLGEAYFMVQLQKESKYYLTLGYLQMSSVVPISTTSTSYFSSGSFYGGINIFIYEDAVSLGAYFSPYVQGEYSEGNSEVEVWGGNAYMLKLNGHPRISDHFFFDISLSYYSAYYSTRSVTTPVSTVTNFGQSVIMPMVGLQILY